jgi:hypothetical protein
MVDTVQTVSATDKALNKRQRQVCMRLASGHRPTEIAEALSMSLSSISRIRSLPAAQAYIAELEAAQEQNVVEGGGVYENLQALGPRAVKRLGLLLEKAEEGGLPFSQELKLLQDVLDRAGFPRQTKANVAHMHAHVFDAEGIARLNAAGEALRANGGLLGIDFLSLGQQLRSDVVDVTPGVEGDEPEPAEEEAELVEV